MHVNVQLRFNPATGQEAPYYRLKKSYRDVRGNVHSLIVLNIGFDTSLIPLHVKWIARSLSYRFQNRNNLSLFQEEIDGLSSEERSFSETLWQRMIDEGSIDRFNQNENKAKKRVRKIY